jgi:pimeloyl-ACP methyl ester carboxylesterase
MTESVEVRGGPLAYDEVGAGRGFLWGHGLTSSRAEEDTTGLLGSWPFPTDAVRRVRYDARGHGSSPGPATPESYRWDVLSLDQLSLADALGIDRYVAGGASMGCATALHAAVLAPERVEALVLVIPPTAWDSRPPQRSLYEAGAELIERDGLVAFAELSAQAPPPMLFANLGLDWGEQARRRALALDEATLPSVLRGAGASDLPAPDAVVGISVPVLILAWTGDPTHPVATADRLAELLPQAELVVAEDLRAVLSWPEQVVQFVAALPG